MRLPKRLMDFLRSRRFRIALAWSPFVTIVLLALLWLGINWYGRWKFDRTVDELVARGFARTMREAIGPLPRDEDNLLMNATVISEVKQYDYSDPEINKKNGGWLGARDLLKSEIPTIVSRRNPTARVRQRRAERQDFSGSGGQEEARRLLAMLEPYEAARRELMKAMAELRPAEYGYDPDQLQSEAQFVLFQAKVALDDHGVLSLAAGRKEDALEDFLAVLRFDAAAQTTAIPCGQAESRAHDIADTLHAALIDPPAGTWTEDELRRMDELLKDACDGELTMEFQRMLLPQLFELAARVRANPGLVPPRIEWKEWRTAWRWEWKSAKENLAGAWSAVRPQGLRDLEIAGRMKELAGKLGDPGTPTNWQVPIWQPELFQEPAEEIAFEICSDPYSSTEILWDNAFTNCGGFEINGAIWAALGRWAIALERHRLRHGQHPEALEFLDADLKEGLPNDPLSRTAFNYRLGADGGYELKGAIPLWKKDREYLWKRSMEAP